MKKKLLKNAKIITPSSIIHDGCLTISGRKIEFIGKENERRKYNQKNGYDEIDLKGLFISPGFFDIHTHGGAGLNYNEVIDTTQLATICKLSVKEGVTTFLPTLLSIPSHESFLDFLDRIQKITYILDKVVEGAKPIGLNLELFMRPGYGAITSETIKPTIENWGQIKKCTANKVKIVTVAPCWDEALDLIEILKRDNVIPSIGHTIATEDTIVEAIKRGASLATHLFNGNFQPKQNQRGVIIPGVNEYLLACNGIMAEIIADKKGVHVHPTMLKIALKCFGIDRLITITDALENRGTPINEFLMDGYDYIREGDVNRNSNGDLCGSALQMNGAILNFMNHTKVSLKDAIKTATVNPARLLGMYNNKGSIEIGKDADLTIIDEKINVYMTIVAGKIQYLNENYFHL